MTEAIQFLENFLSEGPALKKRCFERCAQGGIAPKTIRNAREALRVESNPFEQPGVPRNRWPYIWQLPGIQGCPTPEKGNPGQPNGTRINTDDARVALGCPNEGKRGVGQPKTLVPDTQPASGDQEAKMPTSETCTHERKRLVEDSSWKYWVCVDCGAKKVTPGTSWRPEYESCSHVNKESFGGFDGAFYCLDCEAIKLGSSAPCIPATWRPRRAYRRDCGKGLRSMTGLSARRQAWGYFWAGWCVGDSPGKLISRICWNRFRITSTKRSSWTANHVVAWPRMAPGSTTASAVRTAATMTVADRFTSGWTGP